MRTQEAVIVGPHRVRSGKHNSQSGAKTGLPWLTSPQLGRNQKKNAFSVK